jgi:hypothetical protein
MADVNRRWDVRLVAALWGSLTVAVACVPELPVQTWRIDAPQVLAVAAVPAEVAPGTTVQLRALLASPPDQAQPDLSWHLCLQRKRDDELGPVSMACLGALTTEHVALGVGEAVTLTVPMDACSRFGPEPPLQQPGQPAGRPVPPDGTGGYWLPLRLALGQGGTPSLAQVRLRCGVAGATQVQAAEVQRFGHANGAPRPGWSFAAGAGMWSSAPTAEADWTATVAAGVPARLRVDVADCPASSVCGDGLCDAGDDALTCPSDCQPALTCAGAERYTWFDPATRSVAQRTERLRVSWFATAGQLSTGAADAAVQPEVTWLPPTGWAPPQQATLWSVVRDDRGGVAWRKVTLNASP